jgi:hypothetical protein
MRAVQVHAFGEQPSKKTALISPLPEKEKANQNHG